LEIKRFAHSLSTIKDVRAIFACHESIIKESERTHSQSLHYNAGMTATKALYDGWPLSRQPNSAAARHLLTILAHLPEEVEALVAFPEEAPEWHPENAAAHVHPVPDSESAHLRWEQRILPGIALKVNAKLVHTTSLNPPFSSAAPVLVSPAGFGAGERTRRGFSARLRVAFGQGGFARAAGLLWPSDLPAPESAARVIELPPTVHPDFRPIPFGEQESPAFPGLEMPETYTLYHGPGNEETLRSLLQAWSWAAGPIGAYYPLLLLDLGVNGRAHANSLIREFDLHETVRILPPIQPKHHAPLYQNCSALYHPAGISPWGGPVRNALACARPVVAFEHAQMDALAGPAAFLAPEDDLRAFGAAMISVVIKESIYEALSEAAEKRAGAWRSSSFGEDLAAVYEEL
jgi:hypothetical protein